MVNTLLLAIGLIPRPLFKGTKIVICFVSGSWQVVR